MLPLERGATRKRRRRHHEALRAKVRQGGGLHLYLCQQLPDRALDGAVPLERREGRMDHSEQAGPVGQVPPERREAGLVGRAAEAVQVEDEGPSVQRTWR